MATANPTTQHHNRSKAQFLRSWSHDINATMLDVSAFLGSLAVIALAAISMRFNYELGSMLASDDTSTSLLPWGYALIDVAGLFISGWKSVNAKSIKGRNLARVWFVFLLSLSLFAAWSYQCAQDARKSSVVSPELVAEFKETKDRLCEDAKAVNPKATLAKMTANAACDNASQKYLEKREKQDTPLAYPAGHAVFYVTPYLRDYPIESRTVVRFLWSAAITLTPLVLLALMAFELGHGSPGGSPDGTRKRPTDTHDYDHNPTPANTAPTSGGNVYAFHSPETFSPAKPDAERVRRVLETHALNPQERLEDVVSDFDELLEVVEQLVRREEVSPPSQPRIKKLGIGSDKATALQRAMRKRGVIEKDSKGHHVLVDAMRLSA